MLPENTTRMRSEAGAICVVADAGRLIEFPGRDVYMLDVEAVVRAESLVGEVHDCPVADRSESVRRALEKLHVNHRFSEIHFPRLGGLAFRTLQARNAGLQFDDVEIVIGSGRTSREIRESHQCWPAGPDDLILDHMEQYSSDSHRTPSRGTPLVTVGIAHFNLGRYLPAALESLAKQTYSNLEIIVIDDGSTQPESIAAIQQMELAHPNVRFLRQGNAGIGATRNRLLAEARGEYFIPMDADNIARPEMVSTFVKAMNRNPSLSAMTCFFLAFAEGIELGGLTPPARPFMYAYRPVGGPHALSCIRNVYGDANGIFRTADFHAAGGYGTDRGTSCEDWEAYVKLIHAGKRIDVVPEYLFHYRHREAGFSRATNWFANHQRVMRQFPEEQWSALLGFQQENLRLQEKLKAPRYRIADAIHNAIAVPYRWFKFRRSASTSLGSPASPTPRD